MAEITDNGVVLPALPRPNVRLHAGVKVLAVFAVAGFLFFVDPARAFGWADCPFHALTGFHCPGCGTLRCLHALLGGRFTDAAGYNPLTVTLLPFLAYPFLSNVMTLLRGRGLPPARVPISLQYALVVVIFIFLDSS